MDKKWWAFDKERTICGEESVGWTGE